MPKAPKIPGRKKAAKASGPALGPVLMYGAGGLAAIFAVMEVWSWKTASDVMGYENRCSTCIATAGAVIVSWRNAWYTARDAGIAAGKSVHSAAMAAASEASDPEPVLDGACYEAVMEQFYDPSAGKRTGEGALPDHQGFMAAPFVVGSAHAAPDAAFTTAAVKACSWWLSADMEQRAEGETMREIATNEVRYQRNPGDREKEMIRSLCFKTALCSAEEKASFEGYIDGLASFKAKSDQWAAGLASKWEEKKKKKKEEKAAAAAKAKEDVETKDAAAADEADADANRSGSADEDA